MPLAEGTPEEVWDEFLRRFDVAMFRLHRDHPWARRTLRNLEPHPKRTGALGVDKWLRLYVNAPYVLGMWTQEQLTNAIWHEANHVLRAHEVRLGSDEHDHHLANVAADLEINGDLLNQGVVLPEDVLTHENQGMQAFTGSPAEAMYRELVWRKADQAEPDGPSDEEGDEEGEGNEQEGDGAPAPSEDGQSKPGGSSGGSSKQSGGQDSADDNDDEEGEAEGNDDSDAEGDEGDDSKDGEGEGEQEQKPEPVGCGSGAGGEADEDELGEPETDEQARLDRDDRRQAEDTVKEYEAHGYSDVTSTVYKAAVDKLDRSEIDWRQEIAPFIRQSFEQVMDEAEEYTFKRRSRRQAAMDEVLLPGSFRPTPKLAVVVDVSGSMDFSKLKLALQEVHGILDRLAIPTFMAIPYCTSPMTDYPIQVHTPDDIMAVLDNVGGGTNMLSAIAYAVDECEAEVVVVLTDCDCAWSPWPWAQRGVPVIIGGVGQSETPVKGVPFVEVKEVKVR